VDFDCELFPLHINDAMWAPGGTFSVAFDLELQLLAANTPAQILAVIEVSSAPAQSTPAPVAEIGKSCGYLLAPINDAM
jgi:hypothetical protein